MYKKLLEIVEAAEKDLRDQNYGIAGQRLFDLSGILMIKIEQEEEDEREPDIMIPCVEFEGNLEDVEISDKTLSEEEIKAEYGKGE